MGIMNKIRVTIKSVINHSPLLIKNTTIKFVSYNPFDIPIRVVV